MPPSKRVLIAGSTGQLGRELQRTAPPSTDLIATARQHLDVGWKDETLEVIRRSAPDWIINAAAYTAVDQAESEPEAALRVNRSGAENLALAARASGAAMVQISTDFVFGGGSGHPFTPQDLPDPRSVYGRSKLEGERVVRETLGPRALIVRTAWLYSSHGTNFVRTMLRLMRERREVSIVADQIGSPTWARGLAKAIWEMIERDWNGIHHWTDAGVASWYDFGVAIHEEALAIGLLDRPCSVIPIRSDEYPTAAERPAFSVLDKSVTWDALGATAPHWRTSLRAMLRELAGETATHPG